MQIKKVIALALLVVSSFCVTGTCFASEIDSSSAPLISEQNTAQTDSTEDIAGIPDVTIDDLQDKIDEKGDEIISTSQLVAEKLFMIGFVVSAILTVVAALSKRGGVSKYVIAMVVCGVCWAVTGSAKEIMGFISGWVKS